MTRFLDIVYFGRLDRSAFTLALALFAATFALLAIWTVMTASAVDATAIFAAVYSSGNIADVPAILLGHGLSEHRTAGVLTILGLFLVAALFLLAARARDIGLPGWPAALAAMAVFLLAGFAHAWIGGLAVMLLACFCFWPPFDR
ncbi:MAG: hypothetical protein ACFBRM_10485 [Pikeienuella sp.]